MANAESIVATTEAAIPVYEVGARQSIYALSVLLARQPGDLVEQLSPTGSLPAIPGEIPAGLPSELLRRRPDIRQAEAQLHSATAQIGVAVAQLFPQFSLTGGVNWQSSYFPTWLQGKNRSLFTGPAATWSVFQGGAIVSNIHAQEALRDQAFITYQQTVLTALQEVENALIAFAKEQQHYKSLSEAVTADHKAVDLSLRLFQEGQTDFLNVLTAQRTLYNDDSSLTQSRENIAADLIALYKALGGGWEVAPPY
jgi:NodT family efflux transporter outer membrane factor (OMF) lipoprotein